MTTMTWTTEKPSKPGWYWHKGESYHVPGTVYAEQYDGIVEIVLADDGLGFLALFVNEVGRDSSAPIVQWRGQWAGPIPEPEEARDERIC